MNDPTKTRPFFCHVINKKVGPVPAIKDAPAKCDTDSDCKSYCMNDPTKTPPYSCHGGFEGHCESDDDCHSYCMNDPTKTPPYFCHAIKDEEKSLAVTANGPAQCES